MTLSYSIRRGGGGEVASPERERGQGGAGRGVRVGPGQTLRAVGLLDRKGCPAEARQRRDRRGRQRWVRLQTFHLTLSDLCHHLIYYQGGESEKERDHMRARERQTKKRQHKASNSASSLVATAQ